MNHTKITWVRDADGRQGYTWSPITGCSKISEGCTHCWAADWAMRFSDNNFNVTLHRDKLFDPLYEKRGTMFFAVPMGDMFHEKVPDEFIYDMLGVMALCRKRGHIFALLTKRPERMRNLFVEGRTPSLVAQRAFSIARECGFDAKDCMPDTYDGFGHAVLPVTWPLWNVWTGVSVENQKAADERGPLLKQTLSVLRYISFEPLLGLTQYDLSGIAWSIIGCESGRGHRPMKLQWAEHIIAQCEEAKIPCFYKQVCVNGKIISLPHGEEGAQMPERALRDAKGNIIQWSDE